MKQLFFTALFVCLAFLGCKGETSTKDTDIQSNQDFQLKKEISVNDSISNILDSKIKAIESSEENLENLLNELD